MSRSTALAPLSAAAHHSRGLVTECRGDFQIAIKHLKIAISLLHFSEIKSGTLFPSHSAHAIIINGIVIGNVGDHRYKRCSPLSTEILELSLLQYLKKRWRIIFAAREI